MAPHCPVLTALAVVAVLRVANCAPSEPLTVTVDWDTAEGTSNAIPTYLDQVRVALNHIISVQSAPHHTMQRHHVRMHGLRMATVLTPTDRGWVLKQRHNLCVGVSPGLPHAS